MNKRIDVHQEPPEEPEKEPSAHRVDDSKSDDSWHSDVSVNEVSISSLKTTADREKRGRGRETVSRYYSEGEDRQEVRRRPLKNWREEPRSFISLRPVPKRQTRPCQPGSCWPVTGSVRALPTCSPLLSPRLSPRRSCPLCSSSMCRNGRSGSSGGTLPPSVAGRLVLLRAHLINPCSAEIQLQDC